MPLITEFLASNDDGLRDGDGKASDWIEIQNAGDMTVDLAGYYLTDDRDDLTRWQFPSVELDPGEFLVVFASSQSTNNYIDAGGHLHTNFALGAGGEYLALVAPDGTTVRSQYAPSGADYPAQFADISYGLAVDGLTVGYFPDPTPGAVNANDPLSDPNRHVAISEIMYHPAGTSDLDEFLEIHNSGSEAIQLAGWQLDDGVNFTFPNWVLNPGEYLVVAADVASFQSNYPGVTNVVGGWSGQLANSGERIRLVDELGRTVDTVTYADEGDWSVRARGPLDHGHEGWIWLDDHDGGGKSLELINWNLSNDYGQNWAASVPIGGTPGAANSMASAEIAPLILDATNWPVIPRSTDPVVVRARLLDELATGVQATLHWRVDGAANFNAIAMVDDGIGADERAGDDVFSATVPAQPDGTIIEFYLEASDEGANTRTWPAATAASGQVTNLLYQVDDSFDPSAPWLPTNDAIVRLLTTEVERAELADIGDGGTPAGEEDSDAEMNGTFIYLDGTGLDVRHNVGIRNRGNGTRNDPPNNYRVNIPSDRSWEGVAEININSKYTYLQVLGHVIHNRAGIAAPNTNAVQVRVNGANLADTAAPMYGKYAFLEVVENDFVENHFALDSEGNAYTARRPNTSLPADLSYLGDDPAPYRIRYSKKTNESADDWSDLIHLTDVLNNAPQATYVEEVSKVVNIRQWLRFLALQGLLLNRENGISNGIGDDYDMYRGENDARFVLVPHDLDTIFEKGDTTGTITRSILLPQQMAGLNRLLTQPEILEMYYAEFHDLIANVFNLATLSPIIHQYFDGWLPPAEIADIEQFIINRTNAVLAQIPAVVPTPFAGGTLAANTTLDAARGPWVVTGDVVVPAGVSLTIEPGVTVYFAAGAGIDIAGRLVAEGTATKRIVLTRERGATGAWDGLQFNSSPQDNRLAFIDMSFGDGRGHTIGANSSRLSIDHATWSGTQETVIEVQNPALRVTNSIFPSVSEGETLHGSAPGGTQFLILEGNTFGINTSGDDVVDIGPAQGATPPVQLRRNVFLGGGDDGIDLDGIDALLEENVFMNFHLNTTRDTTSNGVATGIASGLLTDVTLRRNIFFDNDHHVLLKEQAFLVSEHNVYFDASIAAIQFTEVDGGGETAASRGGSFSGDIFWQNTDMFTNERPGVTIAVMQSIVAPEGLPLGAGNISSDPLFVDAVNHDFHLRPGSQAIGTGPGGSDIGAYPDPPPGGVRINEILASNIAAHEVDGAYADLVELYNSSNEPVDLGGMSITDDPALPARFVFSAGAMLPAGEYMTLVADMGTGGSALHLGFALDDDREGVYLFDAPAAGGEMIDSVAYGLQIPDLSIGRVGPEGTWTLTQPTLGAANVAQSLGDASNLRINEWYASGAGDDFVELYNPELLPVALYGLYITDDPGARPLRHPFAPLSFVAAGGYAALIADGNGDGGGNHVDFQLTSEVGRIALVEAPLPIAGDFNGDGSVDAADFVVWRKNIGQTVPGGIGADGDANGFIDASDYQVWRANFGRTADLPPARRDAAVPYWDVPGLRLIDFVTYTQQTSGVSHGRLPDGAQANAYFAVPTPGAANGPGAAAVSTRLSRAVSIEALAFESAFADFGSNSPTHRSTLQVSATNDAWTDDATLLIALLDDTTRLAADVAEPAASVDAETNDLVDAAIDGLLLAALGDELLS